MPDDFQPEERGETRLSLSPLRRLWAACADEHHRLFWAAALALALAGADVALPLLVRRAVDRHVAPTWAFVKAARRADYEAAEAAGGFGVGHARIFVQLPRLPERVRQRLTAAGAIEPARYFGPIPADALAQFPPATRTLIQPGSKRDPEVWAVAESAPLSTAQRVALHRGDFPALARVAALYAGLLACSLAGAFLLAWLLAATAQRVMADLRARLYEHLLRLPAAFHDKTAVGRLLTRVTSDIEALAEVFTQAFVFVLKDILLVGGAVGMMFLLSRRLAWVLLAGLPPLLVLGLLFRAFARGAYRAQRKVLARLNGFIQESVSGARVIQAFRAGAFFRGRFAALNRENYRAGVRMMTVFAVFRPAVELVGSALICLLLSVAAPGIFRGEITLGLMMAMLLYVELLFEPLRDLAEKYNILQSGAAAAERVFGLLDEYEEDVGGGRREPVRGAIEFQDVWFAYRPGEWVLQGVSFTLEAGRVAALVGHTGSGKSTVLSLLLRFYDPQKGRILLDGVDLKRWDKRTLRRALALVLQEPYLIEGSAADNADFLPAPAAAPPSGRPGALGLRDAEPAANSAGVAELLRRLPAGPATAVAEGGRNLSLGERQLIATARALAQEPRVLLMDEATASVDSATEAALQAAAAKLAAGRTAIVIAHRLATIERADRILVMHDGKLAEQGTHGELLARDGLYRRLHSLQFRDAGRAG